MPRYKKRWWKPRIKTKSLKSIFALGLILAGVLLLITYAGAWAGGQNPVQKYVFQFFGHSALLVPLVMISAGLTLTKLRHTIAKPRVLWGISFFTLGSMVLLGVLSPAGAGQFGQIVVKNISNLITPVGTLLTGLTLIIIGLVVGLDSSVDELFAWVGGLTERLGTLYEKFIKPLFVKMVDFLKTSFEEIGVDPEVEAIKQRKKPEPDESDEPSIQIITETESEKTVPTKPAIQMNTQDNRSTTLFEDDGGSGRSKGKKPFAEYKPPSISLLNDKQKISADKGNIEKNAQVIEKTLKNFGIQAKIAEVHLGPSVTQYAIDLAEGIRSSKITGLQNDLALALASPTGSVRIEAPIPGKRLIGIEVPNASLSLVPLKDSLRSGRMQSSDSKLAVALGEDVTGQPVVAEVDSWPHVLVAGATGSGKSVLLHSIIHSILFRARPDEVSFVLVDPKRVELTQYKDIPHLQTSVIVDAEEAVNAFKWAVDEMEKRYRLFQQIGARHLADFNRKTDTEPLPYIVIVVDELADIMAYAANEMETHITRIAQKARAIGIFMILATQRPSVDVITGLIKANIPARIALNVSSGTDSRVILDTTGAEKLLGRGDMLYLPPDAGKPVRVQGVYMSEEEISRVAEYLRQFASPYTAKTGRYSRVEAVEKSAKDESGETIAEYNPPEDEKFDEAVRVIVNHDKASASLLQRRLRIGYARAARLLDELEGRDMVSEKDGSKPREVYVEAVRKYLQSSVSDLDVRDVMGS